MKYWRFNPGQDTVDFRDSPEDPVRQVQAVVRRSISSVGRGRSGSRSESGDRLRASSQYSEKPLAPNESAPGAAASDVAEMRDGEASRGRLRPNDSAV